MNLNTMSTVYHSVKGEPFGFTFTSKKNGRFWKAVSKTPSGSRFLIVSEDGHTEDLVMANADRYDFADEDMASTAARRAEINERICQLMNKEGQLDADLTETREQIAELEIELDQLDGVCQAPNCEI